MRLIKSLQQSFRSKELVWLFVALTLSVTALSGVSFLADRMQRAFEFDARRLLASDLLIAADQPLPEAFYVEARAKELQIAQTIVFPSMASAGANSKLASVKAVSALYPLRGALQVTQSESATKKLSSPESGTAWVEPALLVNLRAQLGDSIKLGDRQFVIAGVLERELDRGAGFMNFAPRVMIGLDDLPSTGLIGLGSRVTYRLLLAGSDSRIQAYQKWAAKFIEAERIRGLRIETMENAQPIMRKTIERAERFLSLLALLTAIVAAVAIALCARRYTFKQADSCAVMKCLGASQRDILFGQVKILLGIGVLSAILGLILGYVIQSALVMILGGLLLSNLPVVSIWPALWSILFAWTLLLGFAGPSMVGLIKVAPIRLIRKEFKAVQISEIWLVLIALSVCGSLVALAARDWKLALWVGLSFTCAIVIFALIAWICLRLMTLWRSNHFAIRFALLAQARQSAYTLMQITSLGIALMALVLILLLRQDLLNAWQGSIPANAPNRFMINIQTDQKESIQKTLVDAGIAAPEFYPMIRGRLISVNERELSPNNYSDENARRLVDREFNLSYTNQLPPGNRIVSGEWIAGSTPQISMETGIAKTLKLKLGDRLEFEVAGERVTAPITSLRKLDWGSMRVNFFVIMPPAQLNQMPQSWITSYFQAPKIDSLDYQINQQYPNLTIVDVSSSLAQIQDVLNKLSAALGLLFGLTVAAALLVLMAALTATQDQRYRNAALLRAIGASRKVLADISRFELLVVGVLAGALAGFSSGLAAWVLGRYVLEIEFNAFGQAMLMGILFGVTASLAVGYRTQKKIQGASAIECLREGY